MGVRVEYRVTGSATEWRAITCEHCAAEFAISVHHRATATTSSAATAREWASEIAAERVARDVAPTRCPSCGRLQANMVGEAKRRVLSAHFTWLGRATILAIVIAACFGRPGHHNEIELSPFGIVVGLPLNVWAALHGWLLAVLAGAIALFIAIELVSKRIPEGTAALRSPVGTPRVEYEAWCRDTRYPTQQLDWSRGHTPGSLPVATATFSTDARPRPPGAA